MNKKYIVRLTDQERHELTAVIKKFKGTSQKVRRAQILSKADADGPNWTDRRIAEAFGCRTRTIEKLRQRLVECGFREALDGARGSCLPWKNCSVANRKPGSSPRASGPLPRAMLIGRSAYWRGRWWSWGLWSP